MPYTCNRCNKTVDKLVALGDAEKTAWLSDENNLPLPQYDYVCIPCALELLEIKEDDLPQTEEQFPQEAQLIAEIESQKDLMIAVATGGPRIQEKNQEYRERRSTIKVQLAKQSLDDPNPYPDLWAWYGRWSSGDLPSYQSRRKYISDLYAPLLEYLTKPRLIRLAEPVHQPTGWARVDRGIDAIRGRLESVRTEEEFQTVGLLCRETLISLAQAIHNPTIHAPIDGVTPSTTDASRMLEGYFAHELEGSSNEASRKHARAALALANELQHRRTATFRDAALCAEATRTVVNIVAIISGKRQL